MSAENRHHVIERIVVIGAGDGGSLAATTLRETGFDGSIVLVGDEARDPYERPPLSKRALTDAEMPVPVAVLSPSKREALDITFLKGTRAAMIDRSAHEIELEDGRRIGYDRLLLATGARPRALPMEGGRHALLLRTYDDAIALRAVLRPDARVGVIGGGFIGLEVAAAASLRGCDVTVLEALPRLMARAVPSEIADVIAARHAAAHVDLRCGVAVDRIVELGDTLGIVVGADTLLCDVVVAGVGAVPNTELATAAGLAIDNGIAVDAQLRTSDDAIFAIGDCCSFPHPLFGGRRIRLEAWRNAHDHARLVAATILGGVETYQAVPWFWSDQFDLGVQIVGLLDAATTTFVRIHADGAFVRFGLDEEGKIVAAAGVGVGSAIAKDIRIAELLIAARACPDPDALADPTVNMKTVMKAASSRPMLTG